MPSDGAASQLTTTGADGPIDRTGASRNSGARGGDYFQRRDPERATKRLIAKLEELGHAVTLEPAAA